MTACSPAAALIAWPRDGGPPRVKTGTTDEVTDLAVQARARPDLYERIALAGVWQVEALPNPKQEART